MKTIIILFSFLLVSCSGKIESDFVKKIPFFDTKDDPKEAINHNLLFQDLEINPPALSFGNFNKNDGVISKIITITNISNQTGKFQINDNLLKFKIAKSSSCLNEKSFKVLKPQNSCILKIELDPSLFDGVVNENVSIKDLDNQPNQIIGSINIYGSVLNNANVDISPKLCKFNQHLEGRKCVLNVRPCENNLENQVWNNGLWSDCSLGYFISVSKELNTGVILDDSNFDKLYCDEGCETQNVRYNTNSSVLLRGIPAFGYKIVRWNGCDSISNDLQFCTLSSINSNKNVQAVFEPVKYSLNVYSNNEILKDKILPIQVFKNGIACSGICLNNILTGDHIKIISSIHPDVDILDYEIAGYIDNLLKNANIIEFRTLNSNISMNILLAVKGDLTEPIEVSELPIIDSENINGRTIRCTLPVDSERLFSEEARTNIPHTVASRNTNPIQDDLNFLNNTPSYYGWIYDESLGDIRECYDFSSEPSVGDSFIPSEIPLEDPTSIRCYNLAGKRSIDMYIGTRSSIPSKIISRANPLSTDEYNVNYREPIYKGWIEDQGEIKRCYEFSGDVIIFENNNNIFEKASVVVGDVLEGTVSVLGDVGNTVLNLTPKTIEVIKDLNEIVGKIKIDVPDIKLKPIFKGVARGADNLGDILADQIQIICIGGTPDFDTILEVMKQIIQHGDGLGNTLEDVYKKIERAVPDVKTKDVIKSLKLFETIAVSIINNENIQNLPEQLVYAGQQLTTSLEPVAGQMGDLLENYKKIHIDPPSISINLCSLIPKCSWKWSYSCRTKRWGVRCSGSNHLSCTYRSSCDISLPPLPPISTSGIAKDMKQLIKDVGDGIPGALPALIDVVQKIAIEGDEFGNTIEDLVSNMSQTCKDSNLLCDASNQLGLALQESILTIADITRQQIFEPLGEILHDPKIDIHIGNDLKKAIIDIKDLGGDVLETTVKTIGHEIPEALVISKKPINLILESIKNIDFGDNYSPEEINNYFIAEGKYYTSLVVNTTKANSIKELVVYKNGQICNQVCQNKLLYGDTIVLKIIPNDYSQIRQVQATGTSLQNSGINNYNTLLFKNKGKDIVIDVVMSEKSFSSNPIITFINTETFMNNIKTQENFVSFYTTNSQGAQEILISPSNNCSVGNYESYSPFKSFNISQPNTVQDLSIRYKNGSKFSKCFNYKIYQDLENPINLSPFTLTPSIDCLLLGVCSEAQVVVDFTNITIKNNENITHQIYVNNSDCDSFCLESLPVGQEIFLTVNANKYVEVKDIYQNGSPLIINNEFDKTVATRLFTENNNFLVELDYTNITKTPNITISDSIKYDSDYYTNKNIVLLDFDVSNTVAREFSLSSGEECSNTFEPITQKNITLSSNSINYISIQFKNGNKLSECIKITVYHDDIAPDFAAVLNNSNNNGITPITITGTCENGLPILLNDGYTTIQNECNNNSYSISYNVPYTSEGYYNLNLYQEDRSHNKNELDLSYLLDKSVPILLNNLSRIKSAGENISLYGTCENGLPIMVYENGTLKESNGVCLNNSYNISIIPNANLGVHNLKVQQTDLANNKGEVFATYEKVATTMNCNVLNGSGIKNWDIDSQAYSAQCIVQSCETDYSIDSSTNTCIPTNYHVFLLTGGRNMVSINTQDIDINKTCANPDNDPRILQYSRGLNIGGLCPYNAGVVGSFIPAINPLQHNGTNGLVVADKVLVSSGLRFAKKYLDHIPATDKILLLPIANSDWRFFAGTASYLNSYVNNIDAQTVINSVINKLGNRALFKGILYHGNEQEYNSYDTSTLTGDLISNYIGMIRSFIPNGHSVPALVGSLCKATLNTPNGLLTNNRMVAINQFLTYSNYVSGVDLNCSGVSDYTQPNLLIMGDRFYSSFINSTFYPTRIQNPITNISLARNRGIVNQDEMGISKVNIVGGTPPYVITTTTPNFNIIGETLLANNLLIGNNTVSLNVVDSNGVSYSQNVSVEGVLPSLSSKSFKTTGDTTFYTTQLTNGDFLDFDQSWSISFKVYFNDNNSTAAYQIFTTIDDTTDIKKGVGLFLENRKIKIKYQENMTTPYLISGQTRYGNYFMVDSYDQLSKNEWHFVTVVYDHTHSTRASRISYYVNGVKINASGYDHAKNTVSGFNTSNNVLFFRDANQNFAFNNPIDDIAFFNTKLTQVEVSELYNESTPLTNSRVANLKHYYSMENSQDNNTIVDEVTLPMLPANLMKFNNSNNNGSYINFVPIF